MVRSGTRSQIRAQTRVLSEVYYCPNFEFKVIVRPTIEATLSPTAITDRDAVLVFDDAPASFQCGFSYQGPQHVALLERWFDDLWANIPDSYLVYSRGGLNEVAIERIRKELAAAEATDVHQVSETHR